MAIAFNSILDIGTKILDKVIPDPIKRAEAQAALINAQSDADMRDMEARLGAIAAEASSNDPWTSRARPMFMYLFYLIVVVLVLLAPAVGIFFPVDMRTFFYNVAMGFKAIPDPMWQVFAAGFLGYSASRTIEKVKGVA